MIDEALENVSINGEKFLREINSLVEKHGIEYMDAIVYYCEKHDLEIETAASIIKSNAKIKSRLQDEAEQLNFLPKRAKLPF